LQLARDLALHPRLRLELIHRVEVELLDGSAVELILRLTLLSAYRSLVPRCFRGVDGLVVVELIAELLTGKGTALHVVFRWVVVHGD